MDICTAPSITRERLTPVPEVTIDGSRTITNAESYLHFASVTARIACTLPGIDSEADQANSPLRDMLRV